MSSDDTSLYDFLSFFVYDPVPTHYSYDAVLAYRRKPAAHWSAIEERWAKLVRAVDELETPKGHLNAMEIWAEEKLRGKLLQERDDLYGSGYGLVFARERSLEYIKKMGVSERDFEAYLSERPSTWVAVSTVVQEIKLRRQTGSTVQPASATPSFASTPAPSTSSSSAPASSLASSAMPAQATTPLSTAPSATPSSPALSLVPSPPLVPLPATATTLSSSTGRPSASCGRFRRIASKEGQSREKSGSEGGAAEGPRTRRTVARVKCD